MELFEPVPEKKELPKHWAFWPECETFVGVPIVEFLIASDGRTSDHRILRSSSCAAADKELLCWLKKWRYRPARCGKEPVTYRTTFSINWHPSSGRDEAEICLTDGEILEWPRPETAAMAEACRQAAERAISFVVLLDEHGEASGVTVSSSSIDPACDQALTKLLLAATWRSCKELRLEPPCTVQYAISLPSKHYQPLRRELEDLPTREGMLPGGKVREFAREKMEEAVQPCRTAPRRFLVAEVELDTEGQVQSIELRTGSGERGCDQAVIRALQASRWASCQELGEPAPCRVSYAVTLGSPLH